MATDPSHTSESEDLTVAVLRQRLALAEARFEALSESISDFYWETDKDHNLTYASKGVQKALVETGFLKLGQGLFKALEGKDNIPAGLEELRDLLQQEEPFRDYLLHIQHDRLGNLTWRTSGAPILDEQGKFAGYRGSVQDISNEVTAEQATRMQSLVMKGMSESVLIISADDVNTAVSGPDALRLIETEDIQPTILLTDVKMPDGMTGCDRANAIRKMTPDCQVIIMPGNSIDTLKDTQSGPEGSIYIQKPFSKQFLGGKLAEAAVIAN